DHWNDMVMKGQNPELGARICSTLPPHGAERFADLVGADIAVSPIGLAFEPHRVEGNQVYGYEVAEQEPAADGQLRFRRESERLAEESAIRGLCFRSWRLCAIGTAWRPGDVVVTGDNNDLGPVKPPDAL